MAKITLVRAGGFMGKALTASKTVRMNESKLIQALSQLQTTKDAAMRDNFSYTIHVNDSHEFVIDREKLDGKLLLIINELEDQLSV